MYSCRDFNDIGIAGSLSEFGNTKPTLAQQKQFELIYSNYLHEIKNGMHGLDHRDLLYLLNKSGKTEFIQRETLSMVRYECLNDNSGLLEDVIREEFKLTWLDTGVKKLHDSLSEIQQFKDSLPIWIDSATKVTGINLERPDKIYIKLILVNGASTQVNISYLPEFKRSLSCQIIKDVCNGNSYQSVFGAFDVITSYYFNDNVLMDSYNLKEIQENNC